MQKRKIVKVTYRYMDLLPTNLEGEMSYNDENGMSHPLVVVKKCQIESTFFPEIVSCLTWGFAVNSEGFLCSSLSLFESS